MIIYYKPNLVDGGYNLEAMEKRYYVYDINFKEFVMIDGKMAELSQKSINELMDINFSFLRFIDKEKYERENQNVT